MKLKAIYFILCVFVFLPGTAQQKKFTALPSAVTGITFKNEIKETPSLFYYQYEYLYNGAGVAVGDINNDGLPDIYFSSTQGANKLYLNRGNLQFQDVTASAGVDGGNGIKTGVNMVDINGDGYLDIFVCKSGIKDPALRKKILYINNKNGTFTDKAEAYGLNESSYTTQAYFFDYDNDGDKDVYFLNHPIDFNKSMNIPATMKNGKLVYVEDTNTVYVSDRLFENRNNKFIDVTKKAALINHAFGLSVSVSDFNNDGYNDLYVANDFNKPDCIYINNKNGTFTNRMRDYLAHNSFLSMGTDVADINNDGLEDIFVAEMSVEEPVRRKQLFSINQNYDRFQLMLQFDLFYQYPRNCLQLNNGNGTYSDIAYYAGVAETDWSWTPLITDFDNDGWKDIYITNGLKKDIADWDYKVFVLDSIINTMNRGQAVDLEKWLASIPSVRIKNYFYRNNGSLALDNYTALWTDEPASFSSGAACADFDGDGDLDLVVNNVDDEAFLLKNNTAETGAGAANYLRFRCLKSATDNTELYGTLIKITGTDGLKQVHHFDPQRGFLSTSEHVVHFGTGAQTKIAKAEIIFPSQKKIVLENITANQLLTVYETDASAIQQSVPKTSALFTDISTQNKLNYTHRENDFIDFKREPLIPYMCSRKGPYYTSADVTGDGKPDIYIGGTAGTAGTLMVQGTAGAFSRKTIPAFIADKACEDMGALFFDADGDKDNDLYVVSGGAEFTAGNTLYQDRLYINDGKGNFTKNTKALPAEAFNGSSVTALDYDADGDLDVFIGGHVMPGRFPQADKSMLLQNNKGVFTNVTATAGQALLNTGIVNCATWSDVDGDGKNELSIAGEWMPLCIYKMQNGVFVKQNSFVTITLPVTKKDTVIAITEFTGWWYCFKTADIDNDGDLDIIMGNRGNNALIKGNYYNPCTVYAKDFDSNGSYDAVLGYYIHGRCYPLYSRDQLIDQMPAMRKKFIRYKDYSGVTLDKLFTADQQDGMDIYKTRFFESGVLVNDGTGNFRFVPFPEKAQFSTISDFVIADFDKDGNKDIIACGNSNDAAVMIGNYDAAAIVTLKGNGNGVFEVLPHTTDGFKVKGECRKMIYLPQSRQIVLLKNNAATQNYQHQ